MDDSAGARGVFAGANPLIPKLLEALYSYRRAEPLSRREYLQLYQINIWIDREVRDGRLPESFAKCIPEAFVATAEDKYSEYDRPQFVAEAKEIANLLLDLRVTFRENAWLSQLYRVDIKLNSNNVAIVLEDRKAESSRET